jgi:hypothetical protein
MDNPKGYVMNTKADQQAAQKERTEQIKNAEAAWRAGEITAAQLLWYRIITAKYIMTQTQAGK